jgi:hypothetical protein
MPRRAPTLFLHLQLGDATYEFRRCFAGLPWNAVGGIYAFVAWPSRVLYIGETGSFASRLPGHEVWPEARKRGAREIYAMPFNGTSSERRVLERALIGAYTPACNTHHRAAGLEEGDDRGLWFDPFDSFDAFVRQVR